MIDALITGLSKGLELSAEEIADTLWLALQIEESQPELSVRAELRENLPQPTLEQGEPEVLPEISTHPSEPEETASNQPPDEPKAGIYPRNPQESLVGSGLSLRVPDAPSLREPLTLARALKPLMRRMPSGSTLVLDEAATTQQIAETGLWLPVLKPTLEPWLDLELVVDEGISMQIWRHTIGELERLLKNYGIFRDVRVWGLIADDSESSDLPRLVQIRRGIGATAKNQSPRSPAELIDPSGRRLILVVSDCVSPQWRDGKLTKTLELWAKQGSMAIVQMLPKWLWKRTALGRASEVRLQGLNPGEFNQKLIAKGVSLWDELEETRGVKVPIFTLEPDRVATWAQMLSGKGSTWTAGYVFKLDPLPARQGKDLFNLDIERLSAEQRVQAFRVTASPMARKLAGLLAAAPVISLPIVRLIQETLLKESQQVHVAEVFLGGLLKPLSEINPETNPNYVQYEFMDGVRELLADSVPSGYVLDVVDAVSKYVARKAGLSLAEFAAVLRNPQQVGDGAIAENISYFATMTAQVLRRLGGEYAKFADSIEKFNSTKNDERRKVKQYWLFQGNPKYYRVMDCIRDLEQVYWLVTRYSKEIKVGDEVAIWISGKKAGVYAFGEIIEPVKVLKEVPDKDYWIANKKSVPYGERVLVNFTEKMLSSPLLREQLTNDFILRYLSIIVSASGTNFKVTEEQWQRITVLKKMGDLSGHFSTLRTKITDLEILKTSLKDLGINVKTEADVRGQQGQRVRADLVAVLEGEYDLGWLRNSEGSFDLIGDLGGVAKKHNQTELINAMHQKYAVNKTLSEAKNRDLTDNINILTNINNILKRILNGTQTELDIEALRQYLDDGGIQNFQAGKYNVNIEQGQDIHIGDRIYQGFEAETIQEVFHSFLKDNEIYIAHKSNHKNIANPGRMPNLKTQPTNKSVKPQRRPKKSNLEKTIQISNNTAVLYNLRSTDKAKTDALKILGRVANGNDHAIRWIIVLIGRERNNTIIAEAIETLSKIGKDKPSVITEMSRLLTPDLNSLAIIDAMRSIIKRIANNNQTLIQKMLNLLAKGDSKIKTSIVITMGEVENGTRIAIDRLLSELESKKNLLTLRKEVAKSLGKVAKGDKKAVVEMERIARFERNKYLKDCIMANLKKINI
jgi:Effector-associated domain 10/Protein of unknown function (DUF1257)/EVE domain